MLTFPLVGSFAPGQVSLSWVESTLPSIPQVQEQIQLAWEQALSRPGIHLFDGPMSRLESFEVRQGRLHLRLSQTSYKTFFGTNLRNAHLADVHGQAALANAVGLSALLLSSDGFAMMGRRNQWVAYYPGHVHPFAGALEPGEKVDVFDEILREFQEELSLGASDLEELICTGIAQDRTLRQPEMMFLAKAKQTRAQIESRLDPAEHQGVWAIPATAEAAEQALQSGEKFTPVGIAAILLGGRIQFGDGWFSTNRGPFES